MIVVVISVAIVMPIQIRRRSGIIVCYMIQILVYLLASFQKQQLLKKAWKKAAIEAAYIFPFEPYIFERLPDKPRYTRVPSPSRESMRMVCPSISMAWRQRTTRSIMEVPITAIPFITLTSFAFMITEITVKENCQSLRELLRI